MENSFEVAKVDEETYIVNSTISRKFVKLGKRETNYLLSLVNMEPIACEREKDAPLTIEQCDILLKKYEEWGFINNKAIDAKRNISNFIIYSLSIKGKLEKLLKFIGHFVSPLGATTIIVTSILAFYYVNLNSSEIVSTLNQFKITLPTIVGIYIVNFSIAVMHEISHASACYKYSGRVGKMGIKLFYLLPAFFCDVSDIYTVGNKRKSLYVASAGLLCNLLFGNISIITYSLILHVTGNSINILILIWGINLINIVCNLFPFAKFDGYWILKSISGIDNLYDKSICLFLASFMDRKNYLKCSMSTWKKLFVRVYGMFVYLFHWILWACTAYGVFYMLNNKEWNYVGYIFAGIVIIVGIWDSIKYSKQYYTKYTNSMKNWIMR